MKSIVFLLLFSSFAIAQESQTWASKSHIRLQPTDVTGAIAEVEFKNDRVHSDELKTFNLTLDGLTVRVTALLGRLETPDEVTVEVPEGYIAVPPVIVVPEGETMKVIIFPADGAGV